MSNETDRQSATPEHSANDRSRDRPDALGLSDEGQLPGGTVSGGSTGETEEINFDDDEVYSGRGNNARTGGTTHAAGGDSGRVGPPGEQLSSSNGPSDPDR